MTDTNRYVEFYENATYPVTVYDVEAGKIKEVKILAYDIDARYGATSKTLLASQKTPEGYRKSRCSEDFYFLTREEAQEEIDYNEKKLREYNEWHCDVCLSDDLFSDDEWKNCKTFNERLNLLIKRARIGSYYL